MQRRKVDLSKIPPVQTHFVPQPMPVVNSQNSIITRTTGKSGVPNVRNSQTFIVEKYKIEENADSQGVIVYSN